jgi:hypothetical protein
MAIRAANAPISPPPRAGCALSFAAGVQRRTGRENERGRLALAAAENSAVGERRPLDLRTGARIHAAPGEDRAAGIGERREQIAASAGREKARARRACRGEFCAAGKAVACCVPPSRVQAPTAARG